MSTRNTMAFGQWSETKEIHLYYDMCDDKNYLEYKDKFVEIPDWLVQPIRIAIEAKRD